jgi:ketosteroid isomerase-like protein
MSPSAAETVSGIYGSFGRGDVPGILGVLDEDIDWRVPDNLPHGGQFNGRDGVGRFFQGVGQTWDGLQVDVDEPVANGDRVVVLAHIHGRLRSTGEETGYRSAHVWTLSDGVPVKFNEYTDAPTTLPPAAS